MLTARQRDLLLSRFGRPLRPNEFGIGFDDRPMELHVGNNLVALIDERDALFADFQWEVLRKGKTITNHYLRTGFQIDGVRRRFFLHRVILGVPQDVPVDHRNGNGLNNLRSNLRLANCRLNNANRRIASSRSGYRGVTKDGASWQVRIRSSDGKRLYLGTWADAEEAARAYDNAARQIFGEFAILNFPTAARQPDPPVGHVHPLGIRDGLGQRVPHHDEAA